MDREILPDYPESPCLNCSTRVTSDCANIRECERYKRWFRMKWREIQRMFGVRR